MTERDRDAEELAGRRPEFRGAGSADPDDAPQPQAVLVRRRSALSWFWLAPIIAAGVVLWLAWRALAARGPQITIAFTDAGTLQPGQTTVKYKGVNVGLVESVELARDVSRVLVHARMSRSIEPYLATGARFWIVQPRVGAQGISGLTTLVSGAYIEMYPGHGEEQRQFTGLEEPPVLKPETPGRFFTLLAPDAGTLIPGAPVTYRGLAVGEIEGSSLASSGQQVEIYAFVRAPFDHLVHPESRFWNEGGIVVNAGAQGVRIRMSSWQQLIAGGVAFDTPEWSLQGEPSAQDATFTLFDTRGEALRYPRRPPIFYGVEFAGNARGVGIGTPVELEGTAIGEVTESHLIFDPHTKRLHTVAKLALDPSVIEVTGVPRSEFAQHRKALATGFENLIAKGLRARLVSSSLLTGQKLIALDLLPGAPPVQRREEVAGVAAIPTAPAADIDDILASVQSTVQHLARATSGPQLAHALQSLDSTLTRLDQLTTSLQPQVQTLVASLEATSASMQRAADAANGVLGTNGRQSVDLPRLMHQLSDAARSVRELADYLVRNPDALLRGRRGDR
ncbi:MAG TPA: MlaD family protein [Steroidobacteraceae bacterium]|nr:MlaD family protein [Steroidobacteraceae bacterium]